MTNCYAFAQATINAGVGFCYDCQLVSPTVVQNRTAVESLQVDPFTEEALALMLEVMNTLVQLNNSLPLPFNNLNNYTVAILTQAYGSAWTVLNDFIGSQDDSVYLNTTVQIPRAGSKAFISRWRIFLWLALQLLLTISAILLMVVQCTCQRKPVVDGVVAAMMLDAHEVYKKDKNNLRDMSRLVSTDEAIGPMRLRTLNDHFILVPENA